MICMRNHTLEDRHSHTKAAEKMTGRRQQLTLLRMPQVLTLRQQQLGPTLASNFKADLTALHTVPRKKACMGNNEWCTAG